MTKQTVKGFLEQLESELLDMEVKLRAMITRLEYIELMGDDPGVHF